VVIDSRPRTPCPCADSTYHSPHRAYATSSRRRRLEVAGDVRRRASGVQRIASGPPFSGGLNGSAGSVGASPAAVKLIPIRLSGLAAATPPALGGGSPARLARPLAQAAGSTVLLGRHPPVPLDRLTSRDRCGARRCRGWARGGVGLSVRWRRADSHASRSAPRSCVLLETGAFMCQR